MLHLKDLEAEVDWFALHPNEDRDGTYVVRLMEKIDQLYRILENPDEPNRCCDAFADRSVCDR